MCYIPSFCLFGVSICLANLSHTFTLSISLSSYLDVSYKWHKPVFLLNPVWESSSFTWRVGIHVRHRILCFLFVSLFLCCLLFFPGALCFLLSWILKKLVLFYFSRSISPPTTLEIMYYISELLLVILDILTYIVNPNYKVNWDLY